MQNCAAAYICTIANQLPLTKATYLLLLQHFSLSKLQHTRTRSVGHIAEAPGRDGKVGSTNRGSVALPGVTMVIVSTLPNGMGWIYAECCGVEQS